MVAKITVVTVPSPEQLQQAINGYIAQGFVIQQSAPTETTMFKKKEFSALWAVIGFVLCVLPLLIYLIVYAAQSDEMVVIRVVEHPALSEDRKYWWNGTAWVPVAQHLPPGAPVSADGRSWWDGAQWIAIPQS